VYLNQIEPNSFLSSVEFDLENSNIIVYTDGSLQTIDVPTTMTRTYDIDNLLTCTVAATDLLLLDSDGNVVDEDSYPWSYDGTSTITFKTTDQSYHGIYFWRSVGITWAVTDLGTDIEFPDNNGIFEMEEVP
jgi:hypothetical protein